MAGRVGKINPPWKGREKSRIYETHFPRLLFKFAFSGYFVSFFSVYIALRMSAFNKNSKSLHLIQLNLKCQIVNDRLGFHFNFPSLPFFLYIFHSAEKFQSFWYFWLIYNAVIVSFWQLDFCFDIVIFEKVEKKLFLTATINMQIFLNGYLNF